MAVFKKDHYLVDLAVTLPFVVTGFLLALGIDVCEGAKKRLRMEGHDRVVPSRSGNGSVEPQSQLDARSSILPFVSSPGSTDRISLP